MFGFLRSLFSRSASPRGRAPRFGEMELARRLGAQPDQLRATPIAYTTFAVAKRSGGTRTLQAPCEPLKAMQRLILRRLLRRLRAHPNATGFERGHSIVTNALPHSGKDIVIRMDLVDFFGSTSAERVERYFRWIGWDEAAARILTRLCTYNGSLPQGAPTSPRLSNLVNYRLDARLAALAERRGITYTRYADDITFSARSAEVRACRNCHPFEPSGTLPRANDIVHAAKIIIREEGYRVHMRDKLRVYRRHHRQMVTGLVVNERPNLPRSTRRRLRAIAHHLETGRPATLTPQQLGGWRALQQMIKRQQS